MKKTIFFSFLFLGITCISLAQTISTIAGTDSAGYNGDNIPATTARLYHPISVTIDVFRNIYITDHTNFRIRKISTSGIITTVVGNGTGGYNGDNMPATDAQISYDIGVAFDKWGNMYLADGANNRIRKINTAGIISTIAGTGIIGYSGDNGLATAAEIFNPHGIIVNSIGNVLFADTHNQCIRKISPSGIISTIAGKGTTIPGDGGAATAATLNEPYGIALDKTGNLYIAEYSGQRIRKVNTVGIISTYAGTGTSGYNGDNIPATNALLKSPAGITSDLWGNLYIADGYNHRLRKVSPDGYITTIVGNGTIGFNGDGGLAVDALINTPSGVAIDSVGNIYISEYGGNRIRRIQSTVSIPQLKSTIPELNIYPNPSSGNITLMLSGIDAPSATVVFSDVTGRVVKTMKIPANTPTTIDLNEPSGFYLVSAVLANCNVLKQIVIY